MSFVNSESQLLYHQHVTVTCSKLLPVSTYVFPFLSHRRATRTLEGARAWTGSLGGPPLTLPPDVLPALYSTGLILPDCPDPKLHLLAGVLLLFMVPNVKQS